MADREQARARSDATARALKGSLSSALGKGLVFSYMPSTGLKVTGKQKAVRGCSPCLASCCPEAAPPPVLLTLPIHPGCLERGKHLQGARVSTPTPLTGCTPLGSDLTPCPSPACCFSTNLIFPSLERQPGTDLLLHPGGCSNRAFKILSPHLPSEAFH